MRLIQFSKDQLSEIISLYVNKHLGVVPISLMFKVSRTVIKRMLKQNGIVIRDMSDSHKGQIAWNKGKTWPKEVREKISLKSQNRFGTDNPNWRGGKAWKQDKRRNLKIVKEWRSRCLARDGYQCLWCGSKVKLEVNHIIPIRQIKDLDLLVDLNNGITLCRKHHQQIHYHEHEYIDKLNNLLKNRLNSGNLPKGQS